jgi:hypothetical protein
MKSLLFATIFISLLSGVSHAVSVKDCTDLAKTAGLVMQQRHRISKDTMKAAISTEFALHGHTEENVKSMNVLVDMVYQFPQKDSELDIAEDITTISIIVFSSCLGIDE